MKRTIVIFSAALVGLLAVGRQPVAGFDIPERDDWLKIHYRAMMSLNSLSDWVNTGQVVTEGWEMRIAAIGRVTLNTTLDGGAAGTMDADGVRGLADDDPSKKKLKTNVLFPAPNLTAYGLIGRIRDQRGEVVGLFDLGVDVELDIPAGGRFEITINDDVKADNAGSLDVYIFLRKKERIGF